MIGEQRTHFALKIRAADGTGGTEDRQENQFLHVGIEPIISISRAKSEGGTRSTFSCVQFFELQWMPEKIEVTIEEIQTLKALLRSALSVFTLSAIASVAANAAMVTTVSTDATALANTLKGSSGIAINSAALNGSAQGWGIHGNWNPLFFFRGHFHDDGSRFLPQVRVVTAPSRN